MKALLSLLIYIGLAGSVFAMHEMDHRYTVLGYVRDGQGVAKPGVVVTIEHKGGVKQQTKTNSSGYYESLFHLHNANLGDEMVVTAGSEVKRIVTAFDPEDKFADRKSQVDFGAPGKKTPLVYWLPVGGLLLLCVAIYVSVMKRRTQYKKERKAPRSRIGKK